MPKYLIQANYAGVGVKGLLKEEGTIDLRPLGQRATIFAGKQTGCCQKTLQ
jgi:hypothetical protein